MTNEEKILDILVSVQDQMGSMQHHMHAIDQRLDTMDKRFDAMDERMDSMDNSIVKINFKLETNIEVKLDALADGHTSIIESLVPRSRVDDLEEEVRLLKTVVRRMSEDIHLLKKAQ